MLGLLVLWENKQLFSRIKYQSYCSVDHANITSLLLKAMSFIEPEFINMLKHLSK